MTSGPHYMQPAALDDMIRLQKAGYITGLPRHREGYWWVEYRKLKGDKDK